jgi:hypothetical protein
MCKLLLLVAVASASSQATLEFKTTGEGACSVDYTGGKLVSSCPLQDTGGVTLKELADRVTALERRLPLFSSCQDAYDNGARFSGAYDLRTDSGEVITVACRFEGKIAWTEIGHDTLARTHVKGCEGPACYSSGTVNYDAPSFAAVKAIADASVYCKQSIRYQCYGSGHWDEYWGWHDRDGNKRTSDMCDNGECSCDKNDNVWREDTGTITDRSKLPITQLRYGDTGDAGEEGYHTLSKLVCRGGIKSNCQQYANEGETSNGEYTINPSGEILKVECKFADGVGTTIVHHTNSNEEKAFSGCEAAGCQLFDMVYDVPETDIATLVTSSLHCKQHIRYKCNGSGLWPNDPYGWWNDKNNNKVGPTWCAESNSCECDKNDNVWREDAGYITDMDKLPISSMSFGDMGDAGEASKVTVGSLECVGDVASAPTTCAAIPGPKSGTVNAILLINGVPTHVVCNFNTNKVELHHNLMAPKTQIGVESPGSGTVEISYANGNDQAKVFANTFSGCTQSMTYKCTGSGVWNGNSWGSIYNYFINRNGGNVKMPCNNNNDCTQCDKNDSVERVETGSFSNGDVPIQSFKFGDTGDSGESNEISLSAIVCNM